jgi:hypothetical protein
VIPKGVRGNKRSSSEIRELEQKIRGLMYSENPRYKYEEILDIVQIPKRTLDRYKSRIWKEDEPKREQKRLEQIRAKMMNIKHSLYW